MTGKFSKAKAQAIKEKRALEKELGESDRLGSGQRLT